MSNSFGKIEKLKSKKCIEELFSEGQSVSAYPIRIVYKKAVFEDPIYAKVGVSVSKKSFKNAVDRNRIKRLLREAYRLNKASYFNNITTQYALMILYIGKDKFELKQVASKMKTAFEKLSKRESQI